MVTTSPMLGLYGSKPQRHGLPCLTKQDEFFKAFGNGSTNRHPNDRRRDSLSSQEQALAGSTVGSPAVAGWDNEISRYPLSPPGSATISRNNWPLGVRSTFPPEVFTGVPPQADIFGDFGQITPPDDENESILDAQLLESGQTSRDDSQSSPTSYKPRNLTDQTSSDHKDGQRTPSKRARKYTPRNLKQGSLDPNNPSDVRRSKFLERNRVAASKCRQKKKEWTQNLEDRARDLQKENNSLQVCIESLNEELFYLRNQMTEHKDCDCTALQDFMNDPAHKMTAQSNLFSKSAFESAPRLPQDPTVDSPSETIHIADEEQTLEALLQSSIDQETSEERHGTKD